MEHPDLLGVVAQPIVDLTDGRAAGFELLARVPASWGVRPDELFAAARVSGQAATLQGHVNRLAVDLLVRLPANCFLTVNLDPEDLADDDALQPLLAAGSLASLVVEVTERRWPEARGAAEDALARLRGLGALLAVDDVGAGFAGLGQISRLRPEFVKLDRALVADLGGDPAAELVVGALGRLCGQLDAWVVAEGVEHPEQLAVLVRLGVPLAQGFLLGAGQQPWPEVAGAQHVRHLGPHPEAVPSSRPLQVGDLVQRGTAVSWERDDTGAWWVWLDGPRRPAMTMSPTTPVPDALLRAVARPRETRWTPFLVTDQAGGVLGHVTMESLTIAAVSG